MLRSLRTRLLVAMIGVAGVSLTLAGWLFSRVTVVRFEEFQTAQRHERQQEFSVEMLEHYYAQRASWAGVETSLAALQVRLGQRLILTGADGRILAVSAPEFANAEITISPDHSIEIVTRGERAERLKLKGASPVSLRRGPDYVGALYLLPLGPREGSPGEKLSAGAREFPVALNRNLLGVIAVVLALTTAVTLWLARRIVGPVETLTAAVEKMRAGDLQQRVRADSHDEIGELARAFNAMSEKLARVEQLRRDMVSDVAHELRTPLTNIRAQIEAIQDGLAQPAPVVIASLHEETLHLGKLVDDLRDLSLADAGQLRIDAQSIAPAAAIEQAIAALQPRLSERSLTIERSYNGALPAVNADPVRLGQILRNLLDNAIQHTPSGGRIAIEAHAESAHVNFAVRDSGPGIAPEHLPQIFERFYRTDPSRARATGGAGLGLAIVKQLVTAHGGQVRAESAPGAGATIHFSLPIEANR